MAEREQPRVALESRRSPDGGSVYLEALITAGGALVLAGDDSGPTVERFWGKDSYEYWLTVKADDVPRVLLELIKDRFVSDVAFREWLDSKGIQSSFSSY